MFKHIHLNTLPKLFYSFINEKLKGSKISGMHCLYFIMLNNKEGQTMAELSRAVHMDKANTSRLINDLKKDGLVRVGISEQDKRIKKIYLTVEGLHYVQIIEEARDEWEKSLFHNIDNSDKDKLEEILTKIIINANNTINKAGKESLND